MIKVEPIVAKEILALVNLTSIEDANKIPYEIIENLALIQDGYDKTVVVDTQKTIEEQEVSDEAKFIFATLCVEYMSSKDDKEYLNQVFTEAENIMREEEREKYDPFKNVKENENAEKSIAIKKESLFEKIIKKIKEILNIK